MPHAPSLRFFCPCPWLQQSRFPRALKSILFGDVCFEKLYFKDSQETRISNQGELSARFGQTWRRQEKKHGGSGDTWLLLRYSHFAQALSFLVPCISCLLCFFLHSESSIFLLCSNQIVFSSSSGYPSVSYVHPVLPFMGCKTVSIEFSNSLLSRCSRRSRPASLQTIA